MRAHFQCLIWKSALHADPPNVDPCEYGWEKDDQRKLLNPIHLPPGTQIMPKNLLKLISCRCKSQQACKKGNCSCKAEQIACSIFCYCGDLCQNPLQLIQDNNDDDEDDQEE